jgi:hypothetical protein
MRDIVGIIKFRYELAQIPPGLSLSASSRVHGYYWKDYLLPDRFYSKYQPTFHPDLDLDRPTYLKLTLAGGMFSKSVVFQYPLLYLLLLGLHVSVDWDP